MFLSFRKKYLLCIDAFHYVDPQVFTSGLRSKKRKLRELKPPLRGQQSNCRKIRELPTCSRGCTVTLPQFKAPGVRNLTKVLVLLADRRSALASTICACQFLYMQKSSFPSFISDIDQQKGRLLSLKEIEVGCQVDQLLPLSGESAILIVRSSFVYCSCEIARVLESKLATSETQQLLMLRLRLEVAQVIPKSSLYLSWKGQCRKGNAKKSRPDSVTERRRLLMLIEVLYCRTYKGDQLQPKSVLLEKRICRVVLEVQLTTTRAALPDQCPRAQKQRKPPPRRSSPGTLTRFRELGQSN